MCSFSPLPSFNELKGIGWLCDPLESKRTVEAVVTIAMLIRFHTFLSRVRPCRCATQFTEDVLLRSMPDPTFGCVNEHELMMLVCLAVKIYIISDTLTAIYLLVIGLTARLVLVNTTNDPTLITNNNCPADIDTIIVVG
jgi:hypothetical protein